MERGGPPVVVVMGVAAAGKSTVAAVVAARLSTPWLDADDLHPAENVAKMAAGQPLEDADRWPWLDLVGRELATSATSEGLVVACSALRRSYRDRLRRAAHATVFIHLTGSPDLLRFRANARQSHFMPPSLLDSQLAALQPLGDDEPGINLSIAASIEEIVDAAVAWIDARSVHTPANRPPDSIAASTVAIRDGAARRRPRY